LPVLRCPQIAGFQLSTEAGEAGGSIARQGNQIIIRNRTLGDIILNAYRLQRYQLAGGPDWINTTRFDIVAKEPDGVPGNPRMMQALLADRFKLRLHSETRQIPVFALVVLRTDRRLGPQLQETGPDSPRSGNAVRGRIRFRAYSSADLANNLTNWAGRQVVDRTGLTGRRYDGELSWTPDDAPAGVADPNAPSLVTAVEEQLGLKLQPTTGPVDVLVIDSVERPTPD
jgi:uncharacterized protein (TIGR03435 family)